MKGGERTVNWDDPTSLKIPPLPPTTTLGVGSVCSLIEVNYFVHVRINTMIYLLIARILINL